MQNTYEQQVYYSDTDAYGVVWHGSYLRWLEIGRVKFCENVGLNLKTMQEKNIIFPVVEINIKYKSPARLDETLIIETSIADIRLTSMTFNQKIINKITGKLVIEAEIKVVSVNNEGKLYRKIPKEIEILFSKYLEENLCKD